MASQMLTANTALKCSAHQHKSTSSTRRVATPLRLNGHRRFPTFIARADKEGDKNVFEKAADAVGGAVEKLKDATTDESSESKGPFPDDPEAAAMSRSQPGKPGANVSFFTHAGPHSDPAYGSEEGKTKRKEMKEQYKAREDEKDGKK